MMSTRFPYILRTSLAALTLAVGAPAIYADNAPAAENSETQAATPAASNRFERNFIVDGNKLYRQKRFAEAETMYKKALEQNPNSPQAKFNLAASYIRQSGSADPNADRNPLNDARQLLTQLAQVNEQMSDEERMIAELANYNLGNISFNNNDFGGAIEAYKRALRINPDDDKARQNLRLAQIKQKEQQQNQDQNQNQNKDQNNQKDQQDQNQQQNQDQDQNNDQQQNQDQNKDQQQGQDKNQDKQNPEKQRSGMSDANAEQILKAMENSEAATRRRVEAERRKSEAAKRRRVTNPW